MSNASRIVDDINEDTIDDTTEDFRVDHHDALAGNKIEEELQETQQQTAIEELPEKFKGKSAKEIADAYTNLEKELGRKGQEIGEMRKLYDSIIEKTLSQPKQESQEPAESTDIFDDPEGVVKRLVQRELAPLQRQQELSKQEQFNKNLMENYPDAESILSSQEFADWVQGSKVRMGIFQQADNWDWDAANELLSTYKALHKKPEEKATLDLPEIESKVELTPEQRAKRDADLKAGSVVKGSAGETSKKVFRRVDIMKLLQSDPDRYYALEPEIRKAYAEGRVR